MPEYDSIGIYGNILHHSLVMCFMGSALLVFIYCWRKGRLDMDDDAANQMMQMSDDNPLEERKDG